MFDDSIDELVSDIRFYNAYDYTVDDLIEDPSFDTEGLSYEDIEEALSVACDLAEEHEQFVEAFYY